MLKQSLPGLLFLCILSSACAQGGDDVEPTELNETADVTADDESVGVAHEALSVTTIGRNKVQNALTGKCFDLSALLVNCNSAYPFDVVTDANRSQYNFCQHGSTTKCLGRTFIPAAGGVPGHYEVRLKDVAALQWTFSRGVLASRVDGAAMTALGGRAQLKTANGSQAQQWSLL